MSGIASLLVVKALDGLQARQAATAQNIANANSVGYRPVEVTFEESLRAAAASGPDAVRAVTPRTVAVGGNASVRLDLELATAAQTAMRFSALIGVLDRQMQIARSVIAGGR